MKKCKFSATAGLIIAYLTVMVTDIVWHYLSGTELLQCFIPAFVGLPMGALMLFLAHKIMQNVWYTEEKEDKDV